MENSDDTEPLECHSVNEEHHRGKKFPNTLWEIMNNRIRLEC